MKNNIFKSYIADEDYRCWITERFVSDGRALGYSTDKLKSLWANFIDEMGDQLEWYLENEWEEA